jgi:transcriptional regulator
MTLRQAQPGCGCQNGPMYQPTAFVEERAEVIAEAIRSARVAELVTVGPQGLHVTVLPMLLEPGDADRPVGSADGSNAPCGRLVGHVARANRQWRAFDAAVDALAVFRAVDGYISPSFYASKAEHGAVVPTWDYLAVAVWGPLVVHDDPGWVDGLVRRLTTHHEASRAAPWAVADAPEAYVARQLKAIVGVEIPIRRIAATAKLSQNRSDADVEGVVTGLLDGAESDRHLAELVGRYLAEARTREAAAGASVAANVTRRDDSTGSPAPEHLR